MTVRVSLLVQNNQLPDLIAMLPVLANEAVREQAQICKADAMANIQKYNAIDTGTMLGSVREKMIGQYDAEITVNALSADGYPYPVAVNYGTVRMAARPFWSDMVGKAQREFPQRMSSKYDRFGR